MKRTFLRKHWFRATVLIALGGMVLVAAWIGWAERHPEQERELRMLVEQRLHQWFPEEMRLPDELIGWIPRTRTAGDRDAPDVALLHGLDEPGGIWDELVAAMDLAGVNAWEFRYPNDQAIDRSADLLAESWSTLDPKQPVVLIGHSMGGLVIRDFVSRWRHPPVDAPAELDGPEVRGVILVGTPNQGSEWARLRVWLELREMLADIPAGRFSLFAGLRDGTGVAKIDLRPESAFLTDLNARTWPDSVPVRIIGGQLAEPTPAMIESMQALSEELGVSRALLDPQTLWEEAGEGLGDGVVSVESLHLPGAPPPMVLSASHRGLLTASPVNDDDPPALAPIMEILEHWGID